MARNLRRGVLVQQEEKSISHTSAMAPLPAMKLSADAARAFFMTLFLFGLLAWLYVVAIQIAHPRYLAFALTHIDIFPLNVRVDDTGLAAFIISALSFFLWRLTSKTGEKRKRQPRT